MENIEIFIVSFVPVETGAECRFWREGEYGVSIWYGFRVQRISEVINFVVGLSGRRM